MSTYVIGDIQGCYKPFRALLKEVGFKPAKDTLWLAGDLVNRGPDNVSVLRYCADLGDRLKVVLGNHDLHLLAADAGARKPTRKDTLDDVLEAQDKDALLNWLRQQPIMYQQDDFCLSHAGVPHIWSADQAEILAKEVEEVLRGTHYTDYLHNMYGNEPNRWDDSLDSWDRLRTITNYFTRMRFIDPLGALDFSANEGPEDPPHGMMPWFTYPRRQEDENKIFLFGHWAALEGYSGKERFEALDSGCVWGGYLTAYCLENGKRYRVTSNAK